MFANDFSYRVSTVSDEPGDVSFESQKILDFNYDQIGIKTKQNIYHKEVKNLLLDFKKKNSINQNKTSKILKGKNILGIEAAIWVKG